MPIDGCLYVKASDGTLVPVTRIGPKSLPLTGGTVQTRHTTIYGHSLLLNITEDEGLMLGTMGPDPDGEFSGIIWTPPLIPGRNGSRVNLSSEFPIMLQTPAATMDSELVNKGYVDAKTSGHCRGTMSGTVPASTGTKLSLVKQQGSADVTVSGTTATVSKTGYWAVSATISGSAAVAAGARGFVSIILVGSPDTVLSRASFGAGEAFIGITTVVHLDAGSGVAFDYYNASGASTISNTSSFRFKYLGAS